MLIFDVINDMQRIASVFFQSLTQTRFVNFFKKFLRKHIMCSERLLLLEANFLIDFK